MDFVDSKGDGTFVVTSTTYNAASQPTQIALEKTDQDDYVYDPNTGRMTQFTFQVGKTPATLVGNLQWNTNGTLNNLAITDGFNSGGTQTCYYNPSSGGGMGYDDWGRLLNVSCGTDGSIWNQTFSYDQYDNLTKSSSGPGVSWNPGYSSSNNQYQLAGVSYDASGDLLKDTFHTYTWNTTGKMASVDQDGSGCAKGGECIVYDALNRPVEIDEKAKHTEIWYTALGKTAYMSGSKIKYAYWPTPGGGTAFVDGNNGETYYMHKDWLGNDRIASHTVATTVLSDQAFAPYGEIYDQFGNTDTQYQMFTGDTQDIVSGMMDTPNREYNSSAQGRWLSPDPSGAGWNQYAYPTNPNSFADPSGLYAKSPISLGYSYWGNSSQLPDSDVLNISCTLDGMPASCNLVAQLVQDEGFSQMTNCDIFGCTQITCGLDNTNNCLQVVGWYYDANKIKFNGYDESGEPQWTSAAGFYPIYDEVDPDLLAQGPGRNNTAANNGSGVCMNVNGNYVCPSSIDNKYNGMEKGKDNFRDFNPLCSTHVTVDQTTGQVESHVDLFNPSVPFPAPYPVDLSIPLHLLYDSAPDWIYRKTGMYLVPAGRTACQ
jgi:RHS repeat-associated protein